jgi:transcriptional regulator with XRE-family HTH domain
MGISSEHTTTALAQHVRVLREDRRLTLAGLAERSGVSRATLSRIENGEVSPTAETLGRLAAAFAIPISQLIAPMEKGFQPVVRREAQSVWTDSEKAFERRSISPPNGQLGIELIECQLGPNQRITYDAPAVPGQEHHLYMLSGCLRVSVEGRACDLNPGDCLRYKLFGASEFQTAKTAARYVIALS